MSTEDLTPLIEKARNGDRSAHSAVYRLAFGRLRLIASGLLQYERAGHTLQPTALVSELFLKLHRLEAVVLGEEHFFRLAARTMWQVLIDHGRTRRAQKRIPPDSIPPLLAASNGSEPELRLAVRQVFERLRQIDERAASTVWLRCVVGLTIRETAARMGLTAWTVRDNHDFAIRWRRNS